MLPSVRELIDVEMLRDGGSLGVTFGDGREQASLLLKIVIRHREDGAWELIGFENPVVRGGGPAQWLQRIKWSEARRAIQQMAALAVDTDIAAQRVLATMDRVCDLEGRAPPRGEAFWEMYQHLAA